MVKTGRKKGRKEGNTHTHNKKTKGYYYRRSNGQCNNNKNALCNLRKGNIIEEGQIMLS